MPNRQALRRCVLPVGLLILFAGAQPPPAEGREPGRQYPPGPPDLRGETRRGSRHAPIVYCWTHWWEIHREAYLGQRPPLPRDGAAADLRERAIKALLDATEADEPSLRAAAAIALGRIGDERALPELERLAGERGHEDVRHSAWVAMGLLNTEESRDALPDPDPLWGADADAWLTAVALLDDADDLLDDVKAKLAHDGPRPRDERQAVECARARAAHVLRIHKPGDVREVMREVLRVSTGGPVDEAILALGEIGDPADLDILLDLATGHGAARDLPVYHARRNNAALRDAGVHRGRLASAAIALQHFGDVGPRDLERTRQALQGNFLGVFLDERQQHSTHGASIIALERIASARDIPALKRALRGENVFDDPGAIQRSRPGVRARRTPPHRDERALRGARNGARARLLPTRSFAAIALGLHMRALGPERRPIEDVFEPDRANHIRDLGNELAQYLANSSELNHFRAACALALGLGGDTANIPRLRRAAERMEAGDELVLGYTLLALGLLGEPATVDAVQNFIGPPTEADGLAALVAERRSEHRDWLELHRPPGSKQRGNRTLPPDRYPPMAEGAAFERMLAARAIVDALAALGDDRAAPALIGEWGKNYYVSLEIPRALARSGHYEIADPLITFIRDDRFEDFARLAALSLGELFDREDPPRLNRLLRGNNFQSVSRAPFMGPMTHLWRPDTRSYANEFLYHYLAAEQPLNGFVYTP